MTASLLNHRYRIFQSLGEGGFGKTFLAVDTQMPSQRQCVIKQLKPMSNRPEVFALVQQRFSREAAVLEAVGKGHSQIPDLYAYFAEGDKFYLVQEWVEGQPLSAMVQNPWPEEKVRSFLAGALSALAHIHSQNIIHRDIKPDNIILRQADNLPCLIDFGAVKELMSTAVGTDGSQNNSLVIGTPGFMPPEQAAGRPVFASDLYSLGMTAIYLLTARSPNELPTDSQHGKVLWQQFAPKVSEPLAHILTQAIHPYPQNRYAVANDMLRALAPLLGHPIGHLPGHPTGQPTEPLANPLSAAVPIALTTQSVGSASELTTVAISPAVPPTGLAPTGSTAATSAAARALQPKMAATTALPWKQIGLGLGALLLGAGIWAGVRPQLSFNSDSSNAGVVNPKAAIADLEKQVAANPQDASTQVNLADAYREVGEYDQALAQLDPLLATEPTNVAALISQGKVQFVKGNYADAIANFTQAHEQDGQSATALIERGNAHYETGEYDKAVDDYRSALRIDAQNGQAYREWSAVNVVQGNTQEALQT
ncbi:MAG: tetratricopeptide repeat protein [Phormidesmis sp. RL_2_1]|nr:tetratricopeptide repeat protein [Phormidesmis sp. RL_2_1]